MYANTSLYRVSVFLEADLEGENLHQSSADLQLAPLAVLLSVFEAVSRLVLKCQRRHGYDVHQTCLVPKDNTDWMAF